MRRRARRRSPRGVAIGAHVAYRDLAGFGRRFIDVDPADLSADVLYQLGAIDALARAAGGHVRYVKPHGALYNTIVHHEGQAAAVVEAMAAHHTPLPALGLPGARWLELAEQAGLPTYREAFADRAYTDGGTLVPRGRPGSVLHDPQEVAARCVRHGEGQAGRGDRRERSSRWTPDSICVHGDTPGAHRPRVRRSAGALHRCGRHAAPVRGRRPRMKLLPMRGRGPAGRARRPLRCPRTHGRDRRRRAERGALPDVVDVVPALTHGAGEAAGPAARVVREPDCRAADRARRPRSHRAARARTWRSR